MGKIRTLAIIAALLCSFCAMGANYDIHDYMIQLAKQQPCENTDILVRITDRKILYKQMTEAEMSAFLCSTPYQTKTIYSFAKKTGETMNPLEFSHFLVDDLFNRKVLQALVSKTQREGMILRLEMMEIANRRQTCPKEKLDQMVLKFGLPKALEVN